MRVCLIGTSHVGPLAVAFRQLPDAKTLPWEFYPVPNGYAGGTGLSALSVRPQQRQLTGFPTRNPAKVRALAIDDYDVFLLIGGQPSPINHARLFEPEFSAAFHAAALQDMFRNSKNYYVYQLIRSLTDAPVYTACEYLHLRANQPMPQYVDTAEAAMAAFWEAEGAQFLPQPASLRGDDGLTPADYFVADDDKHLTPEHAAKVIAQIREVLNV